MLHLFGFALGTRLVFRSLDRDQLGGFRLDRSGAVLVDARKLGQQLDRALREILERRDALLEKQLGLGLATALDRRDRAREPLRDLPHLGLALDVDLPTRELDGQAHVLAPSADRQRELVVRDDHVHRLLRLVDDHLRDGRRRQRAAHIAGGIRAPRHDVDPLAPQLLDDGLDAAALHAYAGADRIDVAVARDDRDFRTAAGLARGGLDRHDLLIHLRHFLLEELHEELDVRSGEHDLRALGDLVHLDHVRADPVAGAIALARDLLLRRDHGLGAAEIDDNGALLEAADDAVHDLPLAVLVLVKGVVAFRVTDALDDHLLGRLGENPAEVRRVELHADLVADLVVVSGLDLLLEAEALPRRLQHRLFEGAGDLVPVDPLVLGDLIDFPLESLPNHDFSTWRLARPERFFRLSCVFRGPCFPPPCLPKSALVNS